MSEAGTALEVPTADSTSTCRVSPHSRAWGRSSTHMQAAYAVWTQQHSLGHPLPRSQLQTREPSGPAHTWCDRDKEATALTSPDRQMGTGTVTVTTKHLPGLPSCACLQCMVQCIASPWEELPGSHHP